MKGRLLPGYLFSAAAAVSYGTSQVISRTVVREMASPLVTSAFSLIFGLLFLYLFLFPTLNRQIRQRNTPQVGRGVILFVGSGVAAGVGVTAMYAGLKWAPVTVVSPVTAINPLVAIGLTHLFLQHLERVTWRILVGALLVVGGVVMITLSQV